MVINSNTMMLLVEMKSLGGQYFIPSVLMLLTIFLAVVLLVSTSMMITTSSVEKTEDVFVASKLFSRYRKIYLERKHLFFNLKRYIS